MLRGLDINKPTDLERITGKSESLKPMNGYFMSEEGRDRIKNTDMVIETNNFLRTGRDFFWWIS